MRSSSDRRPAPRWNGRTGAGVCRETSAGVPPVPSQFIQKPHGLDSPPSGKPRCSVALSAVVASDAPAFERFPARDCAFPASTLASSKAPSSNRQRSSHFAGTRPEFHNCTRSVPSSFRPAAANDTSRAYISLYFSVCPTGDARVAQIQLAFQVPSINRSSLPVISPFIRIPCVMHAVAPAKQEALRKLRC